MPHFYMELVVVLVCLITGIASFRKHDKWTGLGFVCSSIGIFAVALERVLPAAAPWLGDAGAFVSLLGSAFFVANLWHARRPISPSMPIESARQRVRISPTRKS